MVDYEKVEDEKLLKTTTKGHIIKGNEVIPLPNKDVIILRRKIEE